MLLKKVEGYTLINEWISQRRELVSLSSRQRNFLVVEAEFLRCRSRILRCTTTIEVAEEKGL